MTQLLSTSHHKIAFISQVNFAFTKWSVCFSLGGLFYELPFVWRSNTRWQWLLPNVWCSGILQRPWSEYTVYSLRCNDCRISLWEHATTAATTIWSQLRGR